jgi:hypothetical protein
MVGRLTLIGLLVAAPLAAQTTTTRTDRLVASTRAVVGSTTLGSTSPLQVVGLPAKTSQTACAWLDGSGNVFTGACPTGTVTSVGLAAPSLFTVSGSPITTSGTLTFSFASQTANTFLAAPNGSSGAPTMRTIAKADLPASVAHEDDANTFTAANSFTGAGTALSVSNNLSVGGVASHLIPSLTDTYNLGSSLRLWNEGFISQINAVIFAETTATLFGGYSIIGKNAGTFPSRIDTSATTADFGKAMTTGHFIVIRAHDENAILPTAEYMQVGSLVGGTTYNVTRNLSGLGAKNWPAGTSYLVNGTTGDGRIELRAYSTPQISILNQGAAYNTQTEVVRLGYLDGIAACGAPCTGKVGLYMGDMASAGLAYYDGQLAIRGSITVTGGDAATTTYASGVASTAQSNAISTAAGDATTKANAAYSNATSYTNGQVATRIPVGGGANDINVNVTKIDGGKIVTGSITANEIAANAITADELAANSVIAGKIYSTAIDGMTITGSTIRTTATDVNGVRKATLDSNGLTLGVASSNSDYGAQTRWMNGATPVSQFGYWNSEAHWWGNGAGAITIGAQAIELSGSTEDPVIYLASNASATSYAQAILTGSANEVQVGTYSGGAFRPKTNGYTSLGNSNYKWAGGYFSAELHTPGVEITNWTGYSGTALVRCGEYICVSSSSSRYKAHIVGAWLDTDAFLRIIPKQYDRLPVDGLPGITGEVGLIAEDLAALGLEPLIARDAAGQPNAVHYEKLALYLIPVVRQQRDELADLKARLTALETAKGQ